jgi:hypothetical protein
VAQTLHVAGWGKWQCRKNPVLGTNEQLNFYTKGVNVPLLNRIYNKVLWIVFYLVLALIRGNCISVFSYFTTILAYYYIAEWALKRK